MQPNIYANIESVDARYNARLVTQRRARTNVLISSSSTAGAQTIFPGSPVAQTIGPGFFAKGLVWGDLGSYDWPAPPSVGLKYEPLTFDVHHSAIVFQRAELRVSATHPTFPAGGHVLKDMQVLIKDSMGFMICMPGIEYAHSGQFEFWGVVVPNSFAPYYDTLTANGWANTVPQAYDCLMVLIGGE